MDIQSFLKSDLCKNILEQIANKTGLDMSKIVQVVSIIAPLFLQKVTSGLKNIDSSEILSFMSSSDSSDKLLGMLSNSDSDEIVSKTASQTGVEENSIIDIMPMVASVVANFLSSQSSSNTITSMLGLGDISKGDIGNSILGLANNIFSKK